LYIIIFKVIFVPLYKLFFFLKKHLPEYHGGPIINRDKFFSFLTNRSNIHILIIILSILVATSNIKAQDQGQTLSTQGTVLLSLMGQEEEIIIEEGALTQPGIETIEKGVIVSDEVSNQESEDRPEPSSMITREGSALVKPNIVSTSPIPRTEVIEYTVQPKDTIGDIAEKFAISVNTILWENNISSNSIIRPGQKLTILPVSGISYKIKRGDTLEKIAKTYQSDIEKIIEINGLTSASDIKSGQTIVLPGGQKPQPTYRSQPSSAIGYIKNIFTRPKSGQQGHRFPWGQCTWYVAQKRFIPWGGHAKNWIANARRYGYQIGSTPAIGSIIVTRESWYGHVGYVESFTKNTVTFSEANHRGLGVITRRTLKLNDYRIIGYIY